MMIAIALNNLLSYIMLGKQITQKQVKARGDSLLNRKIVAPQKLKILVLAGNELMNNHLQFLHRCVSLIKLDLSHNHLTRLPQGAQLGALKGLQVLQMHYNKISQIDSIYGLKQCQQLCYMTLHHNPLQGGLKYQHQLINMLPSLKLLDNRIIQVQERSALMLKQRPVKYADTQLLQNWKSVENSQAYYLKVLNLQLQYIDNVWTFNNPIVIIQRAWKHFLPKNDHALSSRQSPSSRHAPSSQGLSRSTLRSKLKPRGTPSPTHKSKRTQLLITQEHPLRSFFTVWRQFSDGLRQVRNTMKKVPKVGGTIDKSYMLLPLPQYIVTLRNMRVNGPIKTMIQRIRRKIYQRKMGKVLLSRMLLKHTLFNGAHSVYHIGGVSQCNRVYYNRSQQHIIDNFLSIIAQQLNKRQCIYNQSSMYESKMFVAIRLVDPQIYANKYDKASHSFSICTFLWSAMKSVVTLKRKINSSFKSGFVGIPQISYIKNINKIVTPQQMKKSQQIQRRLQKFSQLQYQQSLWCFQCKDEAVMKQLLRMIYYHNHHALTCPNNSQNKVLSLLQRYDQPCLVYLQHELKRTAAAVTIQKTWRRFISNKNQKQSIQSRIRKNRAALHIQRFTRDRIYHHRNYFSKKLTLDLQLLTGNTLIYPMSIYKQMPRIYGGGNRGQLYKGLRISRADILGASQQFFRPIFHPFIRTQFLGGTSIGRDYQQQNIDIYNLLHYKAEVRIVLRQQIEFISFTYQKRQDAAIVASLIALLTYQLYGKVYLFPLMRQHPKIWGQQLDQQRKVKLIKDLVPTLSDMESPIIYRQVRQEGLILYANQTLRGAKKQKSFTINVEFYQKRYHNFPQKYPKELIYEFINCQHILAKDIDIKQDQKIIQEEKQIQKATKTVTEGLQINRINHKRLSFFEKSQPLRLDTSKVEGDQTKIKEMSKTVSFLIQKQKRQRVVQATKDSTIKKQAQKDLRANTLAVMRKKAKQQKSMNSTLINIKQIQHTQALREKVNKVRQIRKRAMSKKEDSQFIQQNNFVMEQQLKMVIMRNRIKEKQAKKEEATLRKANDKFSQTSSVVSKRSSQRPPRVRQEETIVLPNQPSISGDQGSVVNVRRNSRKPRGASIGAYLRDPSFVHGVFPQEYYPIVTTGTSFYFPPVA